MPGTLPIPETLRRHPTGFWFIFWAELAERASFYGMSVLLALYLVDVFGFSQAAAASINQSFVALCFLLPLAGGYLADRFLGRYWTIVLFAVPYIAGHLLLGQATGAAGLFTALALLALGSGAIKPNTSTLMGLLYEKAGKQDLLPEAFSWYYAAINVGAALSSLSLPLLRNAYGYETALLMPTLLMAVSLTVFAAGRRFYPTEAPRRQRAAKSAAQRAAERQVLLSLAGVFGLLVVFWLVYSQMVSTWIYFAQDAMTLTLAPLPLSFSPDQIQGINPILVIALAPVFARLWSRLERLAGTAIPATRKMLIGFGLATGATALLSVAGTLSQIAPVSAWFMVAATVLMTMAELCISVVGLEFAFSMGTAEMKSTIMASFLLTAFAGNMLGAGVNQLFDILGHGSYFALQTALVFAAMLAFTVVARRFEAGRTTAEAAADTAADAAATVPTAPLAAPAE